MLNFDNSFFVKISKKPLQKRQISEFPIIDNNNLLINKKRKSSHKSNSFHDVNY